MGSLLPRRNGGEFSFFLSYSRGNADEWLKKFFDDLEKGVRLLKNRTWTGFMDQRQEIGQEWDENIANALAGSRVLVSLYSGDYFGRENCGKEFQVFLQRRREYQKLTNFRPGGIIPVLWAPCQVPRTLPDFLYSELPGSLYEREGLQYIASVGDEEVLYRKLIRKFARLICESADSYELPALTPPPKFSTIANAFEPLLPPYDFDAPEATTGPDSAIFVYAGANRWDECAFAPPGDRAFLYIASAVAMGKEIDPHQLRFDPAAPLSSAQMQRVIHSNSIVILLVEGASLANDSIRARLQELDEKLADRAAATVIWRPRTRTSALEDAVGSTLFNLARRRAPVFHNPVEDSSQLADAISKSLDHLQTKFTTSFQQIARPIDAPNDFPLIPQLPPASRTEAA
ncbi:MAG: hypothetical protein C5B51_11085 [Terriglobia bacterium]|nr:MAG: hypothetical protein C5B51_11085 [Terriglobia bacterium]